MDGSWSRRWLAVEAQHDLGPLAGARMDIRPTAVARHAPDDRLAHAAPIGGDRVRVEAGAAVAYEDLDPLRRGLGVDGDRRAVAGELGGVGQRLAGGGNERAG